MTDQNKETELKPCECRLCKDLETNSGDLPRIVAADVTSKGLTYKMECTWCGSTGPSCDDTEQAILLWNQIQTPNIVTQLLKDKEELETAFDNAVDLLASYLWRADYPAGGYIYRTYDSTPFHDKETYRKEARALVISERTKH